MVLLPYPLGGPAPQAANFHRVSFCIGPALYKYGHGLLPGPDLFSQYGAGQGYFFAFLLDDTARGTVDNCYVLYLVVTLAIILLAYHFLVGLLNSRGWAFSVCLLALLGQFYDWNGLKFTVTPSVGIYRAPLLIPAGWLFAWLCHRGFGPGPALVLGAALGLSVFWSTDAGIATACACLASTFVLSRSAVRAAATAVTLTASAVATFFAMSMAAYGPGALSLRYLRGLLAPWAWYTVGPFRIEGYPWDHDNGHFFTLAALVCSISVIGYCSTRFRASRHAIPFAASGPVFLGFVSVLLHAKYAAMPVYSYWAGTALPALGVMAWAVKAFAPRLCRLLAAPARRGHLSFLRGGPMPRVLAALIGLLCAAWLAVGVGAANAVYGLRSYWGYNSLLNTSLRSALAKAGVRASSPPRVRRYSESDGIQFFGSEGDAGIDLTEADVELIRRNTRAGERTAVVSWYDWAYLLEAKRPPRYYMLPVPCSGALVSQMEDVARVTDSAKVLFVDKRGGCEDFLESVSPDYRRFFYRAGESDHLALYLRRRAGTHGQVQ
jgi:hypothetical protein